MKKLVLAVALTLTAVSAQAEDNFIHGQYAFRDTISGDQGQTNRQGINLIVGHKFDNNLQFDLGQQFRTEKLNEDNNGGSNTTRLEGGLTYSLPLDPYVTLYTRGAIGYKFKDTEDFSYYSVEPGVQFKVTQPLSVKVGYRYRDSFSQSYFDKTNTVRVGAQYDLSKTSFVTAGVDRSYGDSQFLGINLGYGIKF